MQIVTEPCDNPTQSEMGWKLSAEVEAMRPNNRWKPDEEKEAE